MAKVKRFLSILSFLKHSLETFLQLNFYPISTFFSKFPSFCVTLRQMLHFSHWIQLSISYSSLLYVRVLGDFLAFFIFLVHTSFTPFFVYSNSSCDYYFSAWLNTCYWKLRNFGCLAIWGFFCKLA